MLLGVQLLNSVRKLAKAAKVSVLAITIADVVLVICGTIRTHLGHLVVAGLE